ncbi:MAG: hypothetical protein AAB011_08745 [Candidatus Eisenbacteria bacterium]
MTLTMAIELELAIASKSWGRRAPRPRMRAYLAGAMLAAALFGCGTGRHEEPRLASPAASALADSLREALNERFKPPVEVRYGKFANPANGDSIPGYVVRISAPFEMVAEDTIPHEWIRARLRAAGWTLEAEADGPDGASYWAHSGDSAVAVEAAWEDLHEPVDIADWYSLTLGIPSPAPAPPPAAR